MHLSYRLIPIFFISFLLGYLSSYVNATDTEDKVLSLQERLNHGLIHAIIRGDIDEVRHLITEGADVNARDDEGRISLYHAIKPSYTTRKKIDDSHIAIITIYLPYTFEIITTLIEAKADINTKDDHDITPLHYASQLSNHEFLRILIKTGADVNAKDKDGNTPLHVAGTQEVAEILINAGADISTITNEEGLTPLESNPNVAEVFNCYLNLTRKRYRMMH